MFGLGIDLAVLLGVITILLTIEGRLYPSVARLSQATSPRVDCVGWEPAAVRATLPYRAARGPGRSHAADHRRLLHSITNSPGARDWLGAFVSSGGRLIVFTQDFGSDWTALPGGQVAGVGYEEDQRWPAASKSPTQPSMARPTNWERTVSAFV